LTLKEDADKDYLVKKVVGYVEQGDLIMANKFMDAYIGHVDSTREEIDKLVAESLEKIKEQAKKGKEAKKKSKKVKEEGSEE